MIKTSQSEIHESVMTREVIEALHINKKGLYIDATIGTGGHALGIITAFKKTPTNVGDELNADMSFSFRRNRGFKSAENVIKNGGKVLGIDADPAMLEIAKKRLKEVGDNFKLVLGNFKDIDEIAKKEGFGQVSGIIFDLGVSNIHLTGKERGFSFSEPDAPLDMRLNPEDYGVTAADLLNGLREDHLTVLFAKVLPFFKSKKLAKMIEAYREQKKFETVGDFLEAIKDFKGKPGLNPATLPFLALRIAVNSELENLKEALPKAFSLLVHGGRLVILSFHSKEEELILDFFFSEERSNSGKILTDKSILATQGEIAGNIKARSAKLRVLEKL